MLCAMDKAYIMQDSPSLKLRTMRYRRDYNGFTGPNVPLTILVRITVA